MCQSGTCRFRRKLFGLTAALSIIWSTLDILSIILNWRTCLVNLDDVTVLSKSFDIHLQDVHRVLLMLRKADVSLTLEKRWFLTDSI